ncbi:MAG: MBL fold metallo-hydrolase [Candidatus Euphemobacter frigidus]|nr:MBL fold metallo-hydrolase [Candidatus Euphemobacter frigidus]MDP8275260.1 MBL fold metallo-hydrolase [Candidatus Euphemobacter frigidus]
MKKPGAIILSFIFLGVLSPLLFLNAAADNTPYLKFCGANGTIFGTCHLLYTGKSTILLDCGLFQEEGYPKREVDRRNRFLPFQPRDIDYILVTHAHGDHIGRIPYLVRKGFAGKIYCTEATAQVAREMLKLLAWILSHDSPLYNQHHVEATLKRLVPCRYNRTYTLPDGLRFRFLEAGHIIGSAMIYLDFEQGGDDYSLLFTGDIGNPAAPLLRPQDIVEDVDYLICESTYGNRLHSNAADDMKKFAETINTAINRGGKVIIPCYVLARTQNILYFINKMIRDKKFDRSFNVYVDSIYANKMTRIYRKNSQLFNEETKKEIRQRKPPLSFPTLKEHKPEEKIIGPAVILAPSGMANVGSIRTHLTNYLPDPDSVVIFVGYQPEGMIGRKLLEGAKWMKIGEKTVPVRAKSYYLSSFSGHADYHQIITWLKNFQRIREIFIVHGQPDSSKYLAEYIEAHTLFKAMVPKFLQKIYLTPN